MEQGDELRIYDLSGSEGQLHLHTDSTGNYVYSGRVYDYSREAYIQLDSYEAAMAELRAQSLGIPRKV